MGALAIEILLSALEIGAGVWEERREKRKREQGDGRERSSSQAGTIGRKPSG